MLTEMALPSDRMRFKDKIIANIAKAIKGIQEAVFFKNQTTGGDSPLILRNNDRQCHKLCENLDHVFLHGLKHHSNGYWKVVTEYTHKNAVREIRNLANVTTDFGRGRAWIFMALNDSLLESYIRCLTDNVKFLRKHYAKDALVLDQQQMSVLLTLTSGLDCVVFQLEYDLPYLDLTAYPPRNRTASEIEEDEADHVSLRSAGSSVSIRAGVETVASTPDSTKAMTDSDSASLSSLDTSSVLRHSSVRASSVSMDSGFPADMVNSMENNNIAATTTTTSVTTTNKQRSVTPTDTASISSHGSAGEPDRLTRLENLMARPEEVENGAEGLEVIRLKGGKKGPAAGNKKKKAGSPRKVGKKFVTTPDSNVSSAISAEAASAGQGDWSSDADQKLGTVLTEVQNCIGVSSSSSTCPIAIATHISLDGNCLKSSPSGKSPVAGSLPADILSSSAGAGTPSNRGVLSRNSEKDLENLTAETKNSLVDRFAQLDTAMASIRATATTLHQHQAEQQPHQQPVSPVEAEVNKSSPLLNGASSFQREHYFDENVPQPLSPFHSILGYSLSDAYTCDSNSNMPEDSSSSSLPPEQGMQEAQEKVGVEVGKPLSALEELETRCAQLCKPVAEESEKYEDRDSLFSSENAKEGCKVAKVTGSHQIESSDEGVFGQGDISSQASLLPAQEEEEDEVDFYSCPEKVGQPSQPSGSDRMHDYVDYISGHHNDQTFETAGQDAEQLKEEESLLENEERKKWNKDYALRLDNNAKLQIMLDVFTRDDEEFVKMFVTREGHSEGDVKVTFVLVTSHTLYLLKQRVLDRKFEKELAIPLKDLSFITLSLNKQIVNIESSGPNRRKERIWLTPGDHLLAQQILDCLEQAMLNVQQPTSVRSHFSIGSDEPLQIIALRKYISRDCRCEEHEVEIEDYSLVFWEDSQSNKDRQISTAREGTMLLRTNDPFKGHIWKPVHVILRDFMLCVFADKIDSKPLKYVRLGGEQCVGCRLVTSQDREHCIEIILAKGESWFLSVASEDEVASWRQSLCLAVSEGMQDSANLSCLPCVSVVTGQKLLLCHEDVQTKFCRTIASAKVEEVTALTLDPEVNTYCVVDFESQEVGVSSEQWVLYFNSPLELDRFVQGLAKVWKEVYQVELVAGSIEDLPLQRHCLDQASLLQQSITMK